MDEKSLYCYYDPMTLTIAIANEKMIRDFAMATKAICQQNNISIKDFLEALSSKNGAK